MNMANILAQFSLKDLFSDENPLKKFPLENSRSADIASTLPIRTFFESCTW
jgi:hypothetical protein